jgi:hypothetical protein
MATHTIYRPESWPSRVIGWLITIVALLVVATILVVSVASGHYELTRTTRGDVEKMIAAELPERASTDQIFDFLEAHEMKYSGVQPSDAEDTRSLDAGVPTGTMTITGTLRNDGYAIKLRDVVVSFFLNAEGLLDGYLVYEVGR